MLMLLAIILDGLITLVLGVVIGREWKYSPMFYVGLAAVHGLMAGFCVVIFLAVRAAEGATAEAEPAERPRKPKVVPIFARPRLDEAA